MRLENKIPKEILQSIDFFNTINGGSSPVNTKIRKSSDGYEIGIKVAGLDLNQVNVEVRNNHILVFQSVEINQGDTFVPRLLNSFQLPADADHESISAHGSNGNLNIFVPLNEEKTGYVGNIDIIRD